MAWNWQDIKDITLSPRLSFKEVYNKVRNNLYYLKQEAEDIDQTEVDKDDTELQAWTDPLTSLLSNLNRIRHQIVAITGEAWGTVSHSISDIWAKFHATTGHKHTGGADDAPKLDAANTHESPFTDTHHAKQHDIDNADNHNGLAMDEDDVLLGNASGLPKSAGKTLAEAVGETAPKKHDTERHTNIEYDSESSSGLDFYYKAGRVRNDNVITNVSAGYVTLADDDVNYVEVDGSGVVTDNIVGFTAGKIPLYEVTTASGVITLATDKRTWQFISGAGSATFLGLTDTPANYAGQAGKYAKVNAGENALEFSTPSGAGDVVGPGSAVNEHIAIFDGTTGKLIKDGGSLIADLIAKSLGTTKGDVIVFTGSGVPIRLGIGSNDQVLTADSGEASGVKWAAGGGGVDQSTVIKIQWAFGN